MNLEIRDLDAAHMQRVFDAIQTEAVRIANSRQTPIGFNEIDMALEPAPTGMIFVPSVGRISHSPKEFTLPQDMANGVNVLLRTLLAIDDGALDR
jgi:N-carbamoyl-L-amino-acid hydrolase